MLIATQNEVEVKPLRFKEEFDLMDNLLQTNLEQEIEILFITTFPPRECGIATYSQDLINALNNKFKDSFSIKVCAIESDKEQFNYNKQIDFVLNTDNSNSYKQLLKQINQNDALGLVLIQHEFGLFNNNNSIFNLFLQKINKPIAIVFHTVLPNPNVDLKLQVLEIANSASIIVVMTNTSQQILIDDYNIEASKIAVIPHGTHLVPHLNKEILKKKYGFEGKMILSTFGLISSGKSIETTLDALPKAIENNDNILFLIIGKTHPNIVKQDGETYRLLLQEKVRKLNLQNHVLFINEFLPLKNLLEYLQLTDIYLFTSNNPNQAVSGTFAYAISCGCAIISTPIPHSKEVLKNEAGIIVDFNNATQLSTAINKLVNDDFLRSSISSIMLHKMASTAWENAALAHAKLFNTVGSKYIVVKYILPEINLNHIKKLTTDFGVIQFATINHPDIDSGYTLDDNARAMVAFCQHYAISKDEANLKYIKIYLDFIKFCLQPSGNFLNYVDEQKDFTKQNETTNLQDSNGRAIWALGYLVSLDALLPKDFIEMATSLINKSLKNITAIHSTRSMAFIIKGLYYANKKNTNNTYTILIKEFANRLVQMYKHEQDEDWFWFESYLTYANSILPEAMLCAWFATNNYEYKDIAKKSFDFLLSKTFTINGIKVISNKTWLHREDKNQSFEIGGEQPIDVAYTILALSKFYAAFNNQSYLNKMHTSFNWFLGNNHLHQIIYNPCTGGCYDGLEDNYVNLNQGAESSVSYLMARLTIEKSNLLNASNSFKTTILEATFL